MNDVYDKWLSEIRSCWHAGVELFEPVYGCLFLLEIGWMRWKKIFTAEDRKIHRFQRIQR